MLFASNVGLPVLVLGVCAFGFAIYGLAVLIGRGFRRGRAG